MTEATDQLSEAFNPATEEGTLEPTLLSPGAYVAQITDAVVKPYKSGKGQGLFLTWELLDDACAGRRLWSRHTLTHESPDATRIGRQQFKDICDACGITASFTDLTLLYNKPCSIRVRVDEGDGHPTKERAWPGEADQVQGGQRRRRRTSTVQRRDRFLTGKRGGG
jgi:hypothetical protein